ncbi:MAG: chromate efflux transporter [Pseudomonadota bacterium]
MTIEVSKTGANPTWQEALRAWGKIGFLSFGGPAAQIALMHKIVVEEKGWLKEQQFLNALNFCMLLPGPEAMQLATYAGWRMQGVIGGLVAGLLFVLPGAIIIAALASLYAAFGQVEFVQALFVGVKAAVIIIVIEALIKVSKRALTSRSSWVLAGLAFVGLFVFSIPFPVVIACAALYGFLFMTTSVGHDSDGLSRKTPSVASTAMTVAVWLAVWTLPVFLLWLAGGEALLTELALFFSKLAVVTFGGAYAVLAYMVQDVVQANNWLTAEEMADGLGLAETTPGPLILVTEFVGFIAAEKAGGFWLGLSGAVVTLWVTFAPCFLWIFAGAPYVEWISSQPRLRGALAAITAAVVGVILNLSLWFAIHVFFAETNLFSARPFSMTLPVFASLDVRLPLLALAAGVMLIGLRWNLLLVLMLCAIGGVAVSAV